MFRPPETHYQTCSILDMVREAIQWSNFCWKRVDRLKNIGLERYKSTLKKKIFRNIPWRYFIFVQKRVHFFEKVKPLYYAHKKQKNYSVVKDSKIAKEMPRRRIGCHLISVRKEQTIYN